MYEGRSELAKTASGRRRLVVVEPIRVLEQLGSNPRTIVACCSVLRRQQVEAFDDVVFRSAMSP